MNSPATDVRSEPRCGTTLPNAPPTTMNAVVEQEREFSSTLSWQVVATPKRLPQQVLIAVHASSVNQYSCGIYGDQSLFSRLYRTPWLAGCDVAGVVVQCDEASEFKPGDRVMTCLKPATRGAWAEYCVCNEGDVVVIPDCMSMKEAAALPVAVTLALQGLRSHAAISPGSRVLICGADSSIGCIAVQVANYLNAEVMAVGHESNEAFCLGLGANEYCDGDHHDFTWMGRSWDFIFDANGTSSFSEVLDVLKSNGQYFSADPNVDRFTTALRSWFTSKSGIRADVKPKRVRSTVTATPLQNR